MRPLLRLDRTIIFQFPSRHNHAPPPGARKVEGEPTCAPEMSMLPFSTSSPDKPGGLSHSVVKEMQEVVLSTRIRLLAALAACGVMSAPQRGGAQQISAGPYTAAQAQAGRAAYQA